MNGAKRRESVILQYSLNEYEVVVTYYQKKKKREIIEYQTVYDVPGGLNIWIEGLDPQVRALDEKRHGENF